VRPLPRVKERLATLERGFEWAIGSEVDEDGGRHPVHVRLRDVERLGDIVPLLKDRREGWVEEEERAEERDDQGQSDTEGDADY